MGGNRKQAQRTKGNTRPSSSSRSAERLLGSGAGAGGFIGFGTSLSQLATAKGISNEVESDVTTTTVDGDCRMLMKKMTKKDSVTRLKALQEFGSFVTSCDEEILRGALPFWPRLFNRLSSDYDRRVREAVHNAHSKLVSRMKRNLAPHLKSVMGSWLMGQCDPHPPASTAAKNAFQMAFTSVKQIDALIYCKEEVLNQIVDVLYSQTPQSLIDLEVVPVEEAESTHERMISVALFTFALFLDTVPKPEHEKSIDVYAKLVSDTKFWKYAKNTAANIRGAWFGSISSLCRTIPSVFEPHLSKLCPLVLGNLDEDDPVVSVLVWEAALHLIVSHESCWNHVNIQKAVVPKLMSVLKKGFDGNAVSVCPNLLPFVSKVPLDLLKDVQKFYDGFFANIRLGLALPKVQSSISECSAIVTSFVECIRYVATTNTVFAQDLVHDHLLPVVESSFVEKGSMLSSTPLYSLVGDYLQSFRSRPEASRLEDTFWETLIVSCLAVVESTDRDVDAHLERLSDMFASFTGYGRNSAAKYKEKKSLQVRFADDDETGTLIVETPPMARIVDCDSEQSSLVFAASKLCVAAQNSYKTTGSVPHLRFLVQMVSMFARRELFELLLSEAIESDYKVSGDDERTLSIVCQKYCEVVLLKMWLADFKRNRLEIETRDTKEVVGALVRMVFVVYDFLIVNGRSRILLQLCLLEDVVVLEEAVRLLMGTKRKDPVVKQWLKGSEMNASLQKFTASLMVSIHDPCVDRESIDATWRLLSLCFVAGEDLEPILSVECLNSVFEKLRVALLNTSDDDDASSGVMEEVWSLMSKLTISFFRNVPSCWQVPASEDLLLAFFIISCKAPGAVEVVNDLVVEGTRLLIKCQGGLLFPGRFLFKAARHVHYLLQSGVGLELDQMETLTKAVVNLILTVNRTLSGSDETLTVHDTTLHILDLVVLSQSELKKIEQALWEKNVLDHLMQGELCFRSFPVLEGRTDEESHVSLLASSSLLSEVLLRLLPSDEEPAVPIGDLLIHFLTVLYAGTYCRVVLNQRNKSVCAREAKDLKEFGGRLQNVFCCLLDRLSSSDFERLYSKCLNRSLECGLFWSHALFELDKLLSKLEFVVDRKKVLDVDHILESEGALHNVQLMSAARHADISVLMNSLNHAASTKDESYLAVIASSLKGSSRNDPDVQASSGAAVDLLLKWREEEKAGAQKVFLFDTDVPHDWKIVCKNVEICKLLNEGVSGYALFLTPRHWDFLMCSLSSWLETCERSRKCPEFNLMTEAFVSSLARLSWTVATTLEHLRSADLLPPNLIPEWDQFFAFRIFSVLLNLFASEEAHFQDVPESSHTEDYVLEALARTMQWVPLTVLENNSLPVLLDAEWDDKDCENTPVKVKTILNHLCPMLGSSKRSVQIGAYHALSRIVPTLARYEDAKKVNDDTDEKEYREILWPLLSALSSTRSILEEMLLGFDLEDSCVVPPDSEFYSSTIGYLLCWSLTLRLFSTSTPEIRSRYASFFRESKLVSGLLNCLFRLMPENVTIHAESSTSSPKQGSFKLTMFSEKPLLDPTVSACSFEVQHLACSVYFGAVRHIPALVRDWFNGVDRRTASLVDRFTSQNVSPLLCTQDIVAIQKTDKSKLRNMIVKARPGAREVVATCSVEDISFEILVKLADNHPLGAITIEAGRPIGVSNSQWSYWTLQLTTFLMHQNGSILDGLLLWKRNIDKKFEGVQECYVCFYVLHSTTCQLPKLLCRTCKKKFHSSCLYKWFSTSGHSTCPLCRSIF